MTAHTFTWIMIWLCLMGITAIVYVACVKGYVVKFFDKVRRLFKRSKKPVNIDERFWGYYHKEPTDIF